MNHRDQVEIGSRGFRRPGRNLHLRRGRDRASHASVDGRAVPSGSRAHRSKGIRSSRTSSSAFAAASRIGIPRIASDRIEKEIRAIAADRNVFFFVSGGVDSTVAYTLCLRALGPERVFGIYVDTGLMREGETAYVRRLFQQLGATDVSR